MRLHIAAIVAPMGVFGCSDNERAQCPDADDANASSPCAAICSCVDWGCGISRTIVKM